MARLAAIAAAVAALLIAPVAAAGQGSPPAAPAASAEALAKARRILEITNPFDRLVEANMVGWEAAARKSISLEPSSATLEKAYPGIYDAAIEAGRPLARTYLSDFVRRSLDYKAALLAQRLSGPDLDSAFAFFDSPAGRRAIRGIYANADPAKFASDLAVRRRETGQAVTTVEDAVKIERDAASKMLADVSAEDQIAIMRFNRSPAGIKFTAAAREAEAKILDMANHPDRQWLARQQEAMQAAMIAFVDAKKKS
jgi:hypothetical protein